MKTLYQYILTIAALSVLTVPQCGCASLRNRDASAPPPPLMDRLRAVEARGGTIEIYDVGSTEKGYSVVGVAREQLEKDPNDDFGFLTPPGFFFRQDPDRFSVCEIEGLIGLASIIDDQRTLIVSLHQMILWDTSDQTLNPIWESDAIVLDPFDLAITNHGQYVAVVGRDKNTKKDILIVLNLFTSRNFSFSAVSKRFATIAPDERGFYLLTDNLLQFIDIDENGEAKPHLFRLRSQPGEIIGMSDGTPLIANESRDVVEWGNRRFILSRWTAFLAAPSADGRSIWILAAPDEGEVIRLYQDGMEKVVQRFEWDSLWGNGVSNDGMWFVTDSGELILYGSGSDEVTRQQIIK